MKEAATPGHPARTRARFRISPGDSPSRIAGCHHCHRNRRSAIRESSHVFAEHTFNQIVAGRNRKTFRACEEAVDDENSLWKEEENGELPQLREISNLVGPFSGAVQQGEYFDFFAADAIRD